MSQRPIQPRTQHARVRRTHFSKPKKRVAIVVPLSTRPELTDSERISLRHLQRYLSDYDTFFIVPPNHSATLPDDATIIEFPAEYFGSNLAHSKLQLAPEFYEQFIDYEYILMYHLDALVFSDELEAWCEKGLDYIGAPWFKTEQTPWVKQPEVGNSGFALMNTRSFLRVLYSRRRKMTVAAELKKAQKQATTRLGSMFAWLWSYRRLLRIHNNVRWHIDQMMAKGLLSDLFWSREATHYLPTFRVATVDEAVHFAFEADPVRCFEMTDHQLPFGCHAWERFDPAFWTPFLLSDTNADATKQIKATATNTR